MFSPLPSHAEYDDLRGEELSNHLMDIEPVK